MAQCVRTHVDGLVQPVKDYGCDVGKLQQRPTNKGTPD